MAHAVFDRSLRHLCRVLPRRHAPLIATLCVFAAGAGLVAHRGLTATETPPETPRSEKPPRAERRPDSLPADAVARLGTIRFRHGDNVLGIAFSPDGTRLLSADWFGAHLWETATGREVRRIGPRFNTSLRALALSADGKTVALVEHHQGMIQLWDVSSGKFFRQFRNGPDNNDRFCSVIFSRDGKVLASFAGKTIRLWEAATGKELRQWQADPEEVHSIAFSLDGKTLISGGDDRTIHFWDTATGKETRRIADHPGPIVRLALSPDGMTLASLGSTRHEFKMSGGGLAITWRTDNKVHLWDAATGKKRRQLEAVGPEKKKAVLGTHPNAINEMLFAPDGKTLVTAGQDRTLRFWDVHTGKERRRWDVLWLTSLAFSADGKVLATGSIDATIRLWDVATGRELHEQAGHRGGVQYLALSPDGRRVATASIDRTVRIWDADTGRELHRLRGPEGEMGPVAFSTDGRTLTTVGVPFTFGGEDKKGRVWDVASGKELRQLADLADCFGFAVSPDGRTYAFVRKHKQVVLWDTVAERKHAVRIEREKGIHQLAFSPDNRSLLGWCGDRKIYIWDVKTGNKSRRFPIGEEGNMQFVTFSPDGRWIAWTSQAERVIRLYDGIEGKEVRRIAGLTNPASCLAFSPDSRMLAVGGSYDPTIHLWEVTTGQPRHHLRGHQGRIFTLMFSADGKRLVSGSADTTALLWDLTGAHAEAKPLRPPLEVSRRWNDLASADAETAYRAIQTLAATPEQTVIFLRKQLQAIPAPDAKRIALWIADLDRDNFAAREKAAKELGKLGSAIEPLLRVALTDSASTERRLRVEGLLAKLDGERQTPPAAWLQVLRAIEVLERIGDAPARRLLEHLAKGAPADRQTRAAKASLRRLPRPSAAAP